VREWALRAVLWLLLSAMLLLLRGQTLAVLMQRQGVRQLCELITQFDSTLLLLLALLLLLLVERVQQCSVVEHTPTVRQSRALLYRFTKSMSAPNRHYAT
jgi:hypothetical protein